LPYTACVCERTSGLGRDDLVDLVADRQRVVDGQRAGATAADADAAELAGAGEDEHHVLAQAVDLLLDLGAGALTEPDHGDHRCDADDDAQRGQQRAQRMAAQVARGDDRQRAPLHGATPSRARSRISAQLGASAP
jgi:hypothetical protein